MLTFAALLTLWIWQPKVFSVLLSQSRSTENPEASENTGRSELQAELEKIEEDEDNTEGFVEVLKEMSEGEREQWEADVEPVRTALFKVLISLCYQFI